MSMKQADLIKYAWTMKTHWFKIPLVYGLLTAVYFPAAILIGKFNNREGDGKWVSVYNDLDGIFFWADTILFYVFSLMGTSLIGIIWSYSKSRQKLFIGFGIMFIISVFFFLMLILYACIQ